MRNLGLVRRWATRKFVLLLFIVGGCVAEGRADRERESTAYAHRVTEQWEAKKRAEAEKEEASERAAAEPEDVRKKALTKRGLAVVDLDGHPKGKEILKAMVTCEDGFTRKCDHRWVAKEVSKIVYLAGMAIRETDPAKAEKLMVEAEKLAEQKAAERTATAEKLKREDEGIQADLKACADNKAPCIERCKKDKTSTACVAMAIYNITGNKDDRYDVAEELLAPPCNAKMKAACDVWEKMRKERDALFAPIDQAWSSLRTVGDDLATKKFLHRVASQNFTGARNARATAKMATHIAALTKDYCGEVKEFLKVSTKAELSRRAKKHCANDPPTATGLGGTEQTLTSECNAVYATSCP